MLPREAAMGAFVYIIRCADGSYYVGNTRKSVAERVDEHNDAKYAGYTSVRRPVELVYSEYHDRLIAAFDRERQIKAWSRRKKEALIAGELQSLRALSRRSSVQRKEAARRDLDPSS
jgi:putative endonuclease